MKKVPFSGTLTIHVFLYLLLIKKHLQQNIKQFVYNLLLCGTNGTKIVPLAQMY